MMHYGSWLQQGALDNNRYYKRCADESREEDSEPTSATPATSCERSSSADMFRLEFAATQCSKLVSNAEGLFNKLVINNLLPHNELDQIERWLCLKQEYEECVASDETASLQGFHENPRRSLERIEEVTETDERTDESASRGKPLRDSGGPGEASEEEEEDGDSEEDEDDDDDEEEEEERSDAGSDNPDFSEKLEEYMTRLKAQTDGMIDGRTGFPEIVLANRNDNYNNNTDRNNSSNNNNNNNNNINNDYVPIIKPIPIRNPSTRRNSMLPGSDMCREALTFNGGFRPCRNGNRETSTAEETPISRRRLLAAETDRRGSEEKRPEEAPTSSRDADTWRTRIPRFSEAPRKSKISRGKDGKPEADAELRSTRNRPAARIEKASGRQQEAPAFGQSGKDTATRRDKRLADDSGGKVAELESSRRRGGKTSDRRSRRKTAAREEDEEEEEEEEEDRESREDAERRRRLGERSESEDETRTSSPAPLRSRSSEVGSEEDVRRNAGTRHPERAVEEKVASPEGREEDDGEKEALRRDIRSLRKTRECLIEAKCSLDEKLQKERVLGTAEDRALSACGESIDVVDAIIEHKNEIMCGREAFDPRRWRRDKCETMSGQLEKLSGGEILTLFYKYFFKVIDLKETSKKLDAQTGQLERQLEIRDKRVLALSEALRRTKLEAERKFMELQREHQEKLHAVFRHLAEEGAAAGPSGHDAAIGAGCELARFKRENKLLRRRLADAEALVEPSGSGVPAPRGKTTAGKNLIGPPRTVQRQLEKSTPKTRVTREGNKLIIQQTLDSERRK